MRCVVEEGVLANRGKEIIQLLTPLIPRKEQLTFRRKLLDRDLVLLAYFGTEPSSSDPDEWRFGTRIAGIRASYYEKWIPTDYRRQKYYLDRAYLHLYIRRGARQEDQILALHCDPNESESNKHFEYKAGPHVHMSASGFPLDRAHIALNKGNLSDVIKSVASLTSALKVAITMVNKQILDLYLHNPIY